MKRVLSVYVSKIEKVGIKHRIGSFYGIEFFFWTGSGFLAELDIIDKIKMIKYDISI